MKIKALILATLPAAVLVTGCNQQSAPGGNSSTNSTSDNQTMQNVEEGTTNAWQKTKEATTNAWSQTKQATLEAWTDVKQSVNSLTGYGYDKKGEYVSEAKDDVNELDQRFNTLSNHLANASESTRAQAQAKLDALKQKHAALESKLESVENSTEAGWNDAKTAFQNAYDSLKTELKQDWQNLSS